MPDHEYFMTRAIEVARRNPSAPFGSILVDLETQRVLVEGINRTASNPILHGEIDAIINYAELGKNWHKLRLYTTAEPCCMCQAAIAWTRIPEVIFGSSIQSLKKFGWNQFELTAQQVSASAPFAACSIVGGVLAPECDRLFQQAKSHRP